MLDSTKFRVMCAVVLLAAGSCSLATAADRAAPGLFSFESITENTAVAIWVPLSDGQQIAGIEWFQSDGSLTYPEILALASDGDRPAALVDAISVSTVLSGDSMTWATIGFPRPVTATAAGVYLIFRLPQGSPFVGDGEGASFGHLRSEDPSRCWITSNGRDWSAVDPEYTLAVVVELTADKASRAIVLGLPSDPQTGTEHDIPAVGLRTSISVYPNPFNPQTQIAYTQENGGTSHLGVYDLSGRLVRTLVSGHVIEGEHAVSWNGRDSTGRTVASGVYFVRFSSGRKSAVSRMTLVR